MAIGKTTLREAFEAAFDHQNLCCTIPSQDIAVQNSPFPPYDPADFEPVILFKLPILGDVPIIEDKVTSSYYSDDPDIKDKKTGEIIKGDRFQGKPTSTGTQFETNDPTKVALNPELQKKFPVGSFIRITRDGKELIAEVDDVKGAKGVDVPKAAADILGIDAEGVAKVSIQLMKPRGCPGVNVSRDGHFLDRCYSNELRLVWAVPSPTFRLRPRDRQGLIPFFWNTWQIADRMEKLGLNNGIARIKVVSEYINKTGYPYKQYHVTFGPFASTEEALQAAKEYGEYCDKFECKPEERATVAWESSTMLLYQRPWTPPQNSKTARYHGDAQEDFACVILSETPSPLVPVRQLFGGGEGCLPANVVVAGGEGENILGDDVREASLPNFYRINDFGPSSLGEWLAFGNVYGINGEPYFAPNLLTLR